FFIFLSTPTRADIVSTNPLFSKTGSTFKNSSRFVGYCLCDILCFWSTMQGNTLSLNHGLRGNLSVSKLKDRIHNLFLNKLKKLTKHAECFTLILNERITLTITLKTNTGPHMINGAQMLNPQRIDTPKHQSTNRGDNTSISRILKHLG